MTRRDPHKEPSDAVKKLHLSSQLPGAGVMALPFVAVCDMKWLLNLNRSERDSAWGLRNPRTATLA